MTTVVRDGPHESKSFDEGKPRETTSGRKEKKQGKREETEGCSGGAGCAVRSREGGRGRGTEALRASAKPDARECPG